MLAQGRVSAASAPAVKANCDPSRPDVLDRRRSLDKRILQCSTRCGEEKPQYRGSVRRLDAAVINESAWERRLRANAHRNDLPVVLKLLQPAPPWHSSANVGLVCEYASEAGGDGGQYGFAECGAERAAKG